MTFRRGPDPSVKPFTRRTLLLSAAGGAAFAGLGARLFQLQVVHQSEFQLLSEDNQFNHPLLPPERGRIVDRYGVIVAGNAETYQIVAVPERVKNPEAVMGRLVDLVAPLAVSDPEYRVELLALHLATLKAARAHQEVVLHEDLDWPTFAKVNLHLPDLPGVQATAGFRRIYGLAKADGGVRDAEAFAHVVGYVSKPPEEIVAERVEALRDSQERAELLRVMRHPEYRVGRAGLEQTQDVRLQGAWGAKRVEVDAYGRELREIGVDRLATRGEDLRLTIDAEVQVFAQRRLEGEAGAAVVVDVENGDIICLVSTPAFDPNRFAAGIHPRAYAALVNDERHPLYNKPLAGLYPPGSTFKMVTALAALRHGVMSPNQRVYCGGAIRLGDRRFHCWKREGHGSVDMHTGIKRSCDIYFYDVAKALGIGRIAEEARAFGLGPAYDLAAPGSRDGTVPDALWKNSRFGEPWAQGETLITGIGQGYLLASPLQLAIMTARLATNRSILPRIVSDAPVRLASDALLADPEHIKIVQSAMAAVVNDWSGTAFYALEQKGIDLPGVTMAGKTGTSQVRRISEEERARGVFRNEDLPWRRRDHALFVCYAPVESPRYACAVIVEHGGSGSKAASPPARDILRRVLQRDPKVSAMLSAGAAG